MSWEQQRNDRTLKVLKVLSKNLDFCLNGNEMSLKNFKQETREKYVSNYKDNRLEQTE